MDLGLNGKSVLITGGSKGIGLCAARAFAAEGCKTGICARNDDDVARAAEDLRAKSPKVTALQADVSKPEDAERFLRRCEIELGGVDVLVNNVGNGFGGPLLKSSDQDWEKTFEINVFQTVRMTRLAVPYMKKAGKGSIVNISSISGWEPQLAGTGQYGSSKAALIFLTERLALELVHDRIRVNTVSPGSIIWPGGGWDDFRLKKPDIYDAYVRNGFPMGRLGMPEEVADVIVFLASPRANWVNSRNIPVDGLEQPVPAERPW